MMTDFVTVFEINRWSNGLNYFYATPAYRRTIAHGGALRPGIYARLSHVDGEIVRMAPGDS
jgi:hypothetical protein